MTLNFRKVVSAKLLQLYQTIVLKSTGCIYGSRLPTGFELALFRLLKPLVLLSQPDDRWNLQVFSQEWLKMLKGNPRNGSKIALFTAYKGQLTHDIALACMLCSRGHFVEIGYMTRLRSPIKDPLLDTPDSSEYLRGIFRGIERTSNGQIVFYEMDNKGQPGTEDIDFVKRQCKADMIMRTRRELYDERSYQFEKKLYWDFSIECQRASIEWLDRLKGDIHVLIVANGATFESAHVLNVARRLQIDVNTFEKFAFKKARVVTHGNSFVSFDDLHIIVEMIRQGCLKKEVKAKLISDGYRLLGERKHNSGSRWGWMYQSLTRSEDETTLRSRLGLKSGGFALVCPNVPFDAGYERWHNVFPSVREWLIETVSSLISLSNLDIVVRAHPAESRTGFDKEKVKLMMPDRLKVNERLKIVDGESDINTYDLMNDCKFGIVFASTTGIEIAMHGKRVLVGADVYYSRYSFCRTGRDVDSYMRSLRLLISEVSLISAEEADLASIVYCIFHNGLQWYYPFDKPSDYVGVDYTQFKRGLQYANMINFLDTIVMKKNEFDADFRHHKMLSRIGLLGKVLGNDEVKD